MCLLINQTNNKPIKKQYLQNANDSNPDGIGFAYAENGKIQVEKFRNFEAFYKAYKRAITQHGKKSSFIVHFRYSTHGIEKGLFNVHPFRVNSRLAFAHNGMIDVENHEKKSDTQIFNETILRKLKPNFLNSSEVRSLIEGFIGSDKLVFLDANGKTTILNESRGHWEGGVWYSNNSYKTAKSYACGWGADYSTYSEYKPYTPLTKTPKKKSKKAGAVQITGACGWCRSWGDLEKLDYYGNKIYVCNTCMDYERGANV